MRHHYLVTGVDGLTVEDAFKAVSIEEMKHAETKPNPILTDATSVKAMATQDLAAEDKAVADYKAAIAVVDGMGDVTTRRILEDILADEEAHQDTFGKMLGK